MNAAFQVVSWAKDSNIYEVNLRQYTPEGSFRAFAHHLPRLRDMGIEILWFMPVTPISKLGRLGTLGSYYACSDYMNTNPEFGSIEDFQWLVDQAHQQGFKVLMDWVANHTGLDHVWAKEHPEFYRKNASGEFYDAHGWADVIDLNYDSPELRKTMIRAMQFWVESCRIDGFRCDMAMLVPLEFWKQARTALDLIKPLLWLAECEEIMYHEVFDVSYTWKWLHIMEAYWKKTDDMQGLLRVLYYYNHQFPSNALRAYFTSNHDENSHSGTEYERIGEAAIPFAVFCCLFDGLPLIYSGQELPNKKRLLFFEKDEIEWKEPHLLFELYKALLHLRKTNPALTGGDLQRKALILSNTASDFVFSFIRRYQRDEVLVILNLSAETKSVIITGQTLAGSYKNVLDSGAPDLISGQPVLLKGWDYRVYIK
ncbi:MAG: alpha-amylase family glycosyl hydrolase [Bacteroidota bacterium]|nr:alpha-amylase family glycosyl hydrolase [Bacteroidota bacterium]